MHGMRTSCWLPARLFSFMYDKHCEPRCHSNVQTWRVTVSPEQFDRQNSMNSKIKNKKSKKKNIKMEAQPGKAEDLFAKEPGAARRKNLFERKCSVCGSPQARGHQILGGFGNVSHTQRLKRWFDFKRLRNRKRVVSISRL